MADEKKYIYPVEELDKIIQQIDQGIMPMIDDQMAMEVKMRQKEIENELFGDDDEEVLDSETMKKHHEMVKKHLEDSRRKASRDDVYIMTISQDQKDIIRAEMEGSIVRPNPNNAYNKPDDELYVDNERRIIHQRLAGLKNCYYNQADYINAMNILRDAIMYSLEHDYPWLSKEEAIREFNEGNIKFRYCNPPKLYINHSTQITDTEVLKGIITGDIILKDRREDNDRINRHKNKKYEPVAVDYDIVGSEEYARMVAAHKQGYDTPMSTAIRHRATTYNRMAIPASNIFAKRDLIGNQDPLLFDWMKEGAGKEYYDLIKGKRATTSDVVNVVNSDNDDMLNNIFVHNLNNFLRSMKVGSQQTDGYEYTMPGQQYVVPQYNQDAARVEQELLASIRANNPG